MLPEAKRKKLTSVHGEKTQLLISIHQITQNKVSIHTAQGINLNGKPVFPQMLLMKSHRTVTFSLEINFTKP